MCSVQSNERVRIKCVQNCFRRHSTTETAGKKDGYCRNLALMCTVTSPWRLPKHNQRGWTLTEAELLSPNAISNTAITADITKGCGIYGDAHSYANMYRHRSRHWAKRDAEFSNFARRCVLMHRQHFLQFPYKIMTWNICTEWPKKLYTHFILILMSKECICFLGHSVYINNYKNCDYIPRISQCYFRTK